MTGPLLAWLPDGPEQGVEASLPGLPADYASYIGHEIELSLPGTNRRVSIRIGRCDGYFCGVLTDLEERYLLLGQLKDKTEDLEEKVVELSRSKSAILNILEDLEERSRELSTRKDELERLNFDLQHSNREMERANRELRSLDQIKSNLLSNISHELRTPLVAIKGYSDLIYREKLGPLTSGQREGLAVSMKSQDRLIELINNLLDFSKIEIGRLMLRVAAFSVAELIEETTSSMAQRVSERNLTLKVHGAEDSGSFIGDRSKIAQILTNLLTNAIKFNTDHGHVDLRVSRDGTDLLLEVSDTGIGIAPDYIVSVFERFFQIDSSMTRRYGGTGLGLSIVKSLVELHGGSIQVVSEEEQGTTFYLRIPEIQESA